VERLIDKVLSIKETVKVIKGIKSSRIQAMCAFLYLYGMRISELLGGTSKLKNGKDVMIRPIRKYQVKPSRINEHPVLVCESIYCEKRGSEMYRTLAIRSDLYPEKELVPIVIDWCDTLNNDISPLFPSAKQPSMSRQHAHYLMKKHVGKSYHPHFWRHCRATHLTNKYNFKEYKLRYWFGWSKRSDMPSNYTHLDWKDMVAEINNSSFNQA